MRNSRVGLVFFFHRSKFESATKKALGMAPPEMPERVLVLDSLKQEFDTRMGPPRIALRDTNGGAAIPEWIEVLKGDIARRSEEVHSKL